VEPPGPIPNPEVKRCSADGSETIGLVRVGRRQVYEPGIRKDTGLSVFQDIVPFGLTRLNPSDWTDQTDWTDLQSTKKPLPLMSGFCVGECLT
jgi:hypothetical protein